MMISNNFIFVLVYYLTRNPAQFGPNIFSPQHKVLSVRLNASIKSNMRFLVAFGVMHATLYT